MAEPRESDWRCRVRVLRKRHSRSPERLELVFGGFRLSPLELLLQWLVLPDGLVQQALAAMAGGKLRCWADFRGSGLDDEGLEKLLKCLASMPVMVERLYLASNSITQRSTSCLKEFIKSADGIRTLDLSSNSVDDSSSFSLLSCIADSASSQLVSVFLADNLIRNPPALIERLRRANRVLMLDEHLPDDADAKRVGPVKIHLPFLLFQRPVKSDLPIGKASRSPAPADAPALPVKNIMSLAASVEVDTAIQSLKSMLPELPEDVKTGLEETSSSTASFLAKINSFLKTVDVSAPIGAESEATPATRIKTEVSAVPTPAETVALQAATPKPASQAIHSTVPVAQPKPAPPQLSQVAPNQQSQPQPLPATLGLSQTVPTMAPQQTMPSTQVMHVAKMTEPAQGIAAPLQMPSPQAMQGLQLTPMTPTMPLPQAMPGVQLPQVSPTMPPHPIPAAQAMPQGQLTQLVPNMPGPQSVPSPHAVPGAQLTQVAPAVPAHSVPTPHPAMPSVLLPPQPMPSPQALPRAHLAQMAAAQTMPPATGAPQTFPLLHGGALTGTTGKASAIAGSKRIRPPTPPHPHFSNPAVPMRTAQTKEAPPQALGTPNGTTSNNNKAVVMAKYEAALLGGDDAESKQQEDVEVREAPWKSQRKRIRRTS